MNKDIYYLGRLNHKQMLFTMLYVPEFQNLFCIPRQTSPRMKCKETKCKAGNRGVFWLRMSHPGRGNTCRAGWACCSVTSSMPRHSAASRRPGEVVFCECQETLGVHLRFKKVRAVGGEFQQSFGYRNSLWGALLVRLSSFFFLPLFVRRYFNQLL